MSFFYNPEARAEFLQVPSVITTTNSCWALYGQGFRISKVLMSVSYSSFLYSSPSLPREQIDYTRKRDEKTENREKSNDLAGPEPIKERELKF